ncbi:alkene reductase [Ideonella azotifigens]|uniref:Alkene reductase n=1 Tax=Ideonella azotifigens TaxID=513160 RepID=A0ABP3VJH2_9BURK|nr:alkene reductase [Ideonella azotifigens]MCD2344023.1 alkene reductase [Ideonella azotifigens]
MSNLFSPLQVGQIALENRVVMAPLTRNRASAGRVPNDLMVEYYRQRAKPATGMGLIITEASQISPMGQGYLDTPGIYSPEQVAGWKKVTDAVHAEGGKIVIQLWHVGRISHTSLLPEGAQPVSSTEKAANTKTYTAEGFAPVSAPRALTLPEIAETIEDYRKAARNAIEAGFDGVEIHAANGYLLEQFLRDSCNDRTDAYGGSMENRARLTLEVATVIVEEIGAGRTGIRLSPITPANDIGQDSNPQALFEYVVKGLARLGLAYVHVVEGATGGPRDLSDEGITFDFPALKKLFPGAWMVNNGYDRAMAMDAIETGKADLIAFGKPAIANPDLTYRLEKNAELAVPDMKRLYGGSGPEGYTDYPSLG